MPRKGRDTSTFYEEHLRMTQVQLRTTGSLPRRAQPYHSKLSFSYYGHSIKRLGGGGGGVGGGMVRRKLNKS